MYQLKLKAEREGQVKEFDMPSFTYEASAVTFLKAATASLICAGYEIISSKVVPDLFDLLQKEWDDEDQKHQDECKHLETVKAGQGELECLECGLVFDQDPLGGDGPED